MGWTVEVRHTSIWITEIESDHLVSDLQDGACCTDLSVQLTYLFGPFYVSAQGRPVARLLNYIHIVTYLRGLDT